jgi:hypothetical protein
MVAISGKKKMGRNNANESGFGEYRAVTDGCAQALPRSPVRRSGFIEGIVTVESLEKGCFQCTSGETFVRRKRKEPPIYLLQRPTLATSPLQARENSHFFFISL